ncbi:MAG: hypothetical protein IID54_07010 [Proteobacteria bacterium]|nr:hypothetical protein [Pseudomonadota bacterium]
MVAKSFAALAYALLVAGVLPRKNRRVHMTLMASGIGLDTVLVLTLQVQRQVIQEAVTESFNLLQAGHILSSTLAFLLYFPVVALGVNQFLGRGGARGRAWHIRLAVTAFCFRTAGFFLMFSM